MSSRDALGLDARTESVRVVEAEMTGLIARIRDLMREAAEAIAPGLHPGEYKTFTMIARRGPLSAAALAEVMSADKGQLSRTVRHLEELGLIERTADPHDRRSALLSATAEGLARLNDSPAAGGSRLHDALRDWELDDIRRFAVYLHALGERAAPGSFEDIIPLPAARES